MHSAQSIYQFLDFRLDARARTLTKEGVAITMTPKVFDTLLFLVENAGQVVTKEQFFARVWPDTVVEESNLSQNIFLLRKLLGEKESGQKIILNRPGAGYAFLPTVNEIKEPADIQQSAPTLPPRWRKPGFALAAGAALIASLALSRVGWHASVTSGNRKWVIGSQQGVESYPAFSRDGTQLAFTWDGGKQFAPASLYVQQFRDLGLR